MDTREDEVRHRSLDGIHGVFFIQHDDGKRVAELAYTLAGANAIVNHTYVAPELRGGALAHRLVDAVTDWARREHHGIVPMCSYVRSVFDRSPEKYADVRAHYD